MTRRRRIVTAVCALPVAAALLVAGSVWSESAAPSDAPGASAISRIRGAVTRPVVEAISRSAQRRVRSACEERMLLTGRTTAETIAAMRDPSLSDRERGLAAVRLARSGSREAVDALVAMLRDSAPEHRAFLAQLVGSTGDASVVPWILPLVSDPDERVAAAAIRGLAAIDGWDAAPTLTGILLDDARPPRLRVEAARGLGQAGTTTARDALAAAASSAHDEDLAVEILNGLGRYRFEEVGAQFVRATSSASPGWMRAAAAEALVHSSGDAVPFLVGLARADADDDVRAAAAWALSGHEDAADASQAIEDMLATEPDARVRRRLYEASVPQRGARAAVLLPLALAETDTAARVAGFNAAAAAVGADAGAAARFDTEAVPELARIAGSETSLNLRVRAVFALRRARTAGALAALGGLVASPCREVASAARHGIGTPGGAGERSR